MLNPVQQGERYELHSPTAMPRAAGFLWNKKMMMQMNCRGYAVAQFMQPEPAKYAYAPNLEAKTFMQPEQPYYAHHPGRFFYLKDEETNEIFSAPYEPVRAQLDKFVFSAGKADIQWVIEKSGLRVELSVSLPTDDVVELWQCKLTNLSNRNRKISLYPYFPIGYMSWMNQAAEYNDELQGIIASCVTPYQKVADYFKNKNFKDKTFFLSDRAPHAWETKQEVFEGEGGLHNPSGLQLPQLAKGDARYETPAAVMQFQIDLPAGGSEVNKFLFGPAFDLQEIKQIREKYFSPQAFEQSRNAYIEYLSQGLGNLHIETPDLELNNFVNHWLPRQVFYHGDVNRLTTDPQTRNYLQDNMGMSYIKPIVARNAFIHALSQQEKTGAMPDGILLVEGAELKYINQIPHTDHCVWLPVCLKAYLDETNDYDLLDVAVLGVDDQKNETVFERMNRAMDWLLAARDDRGLSFIAQGDWCDPMNMVGYKGKGVSGWLSVATAYALNVWAEMCSQKNNPLLAEKYFSGAREINAAVNQFLWDGDWFARGITDDNVVFGVKKDPEGRIFLNPQSWAVLAGAATDTQIKKMLAAVEEELETPYGVTMLAPPYSAMRDDVGRVTQKFPGSAENGSVYNHAAIFYIYSLYSITESDKAFQLLRQMIPGPSSEDYLQRGQLPIFIPNYYRGAYHQYPRTAGRSSQLFNTGTVSWFYRSLVEGLFGVKGNREGLVVQPQLPGHWQTANIVRHFRGAQFVIQMHRADVKKMAIEVDGVLLAGNVIKNLLEGKTYQVKVSLPE